MICQKSLSDGPYMAVQVVVLFIYVLSTIVYVRMAGTMQLPSELHAFFFIEADSYMDADSLIEVVANRLITKSSSTALD